jgi:hypothetical protein
MKKERIVLWEFLQGVCTGGGYAAVRSNRCQGTKQRACRTSETNAIPVGRKNTFTVGSLLASGELEVIFRRRRIMRYKAGENYLVGKFIGSTSRQKLE